MQDLDPHEVIHWLGEFLVMPGMAIREVPEHVFCVLIQEGLLAVNGELTEEGLAYV